MISSLSDSSSACKVASHPHVPHVSNHVSDYFLFPNFLIEAPDSFGPSLSRCTIRLAWAVFHSSQEFAFVLVSLFVGLLTLPSHLSVVELTLVRALINDCEELALPLSDSVAPVAFIPVSVMVLESTETVLLTLGKHAFVGASVWCSELSLALALVLHELAYVFSVHVVQGSFAMLHALIPLAVVNGAFCKSHSPLAVMIVVLGLADVDVPTDSDRASMAMLLVVCPVTLVELASALESNTSSVTECVLVLSLAHILGIRFIVAPVSVLLDVFVNVLRCVRFELFIVIFTKLEVNLSD